MEWRLSNSTVLSTSMPTAGRWVRNREPPTEPVTATMRSGLCPICNRVYVPARSTCKYCFGQISEWVEVSDKGTLLTYTVDCQSNAMQPVEPPIIYGIIQLDGADTGLLHMLGEVDLEQLKIGMRLQAVFQEKRVGSILDIKYFKPVG